MRDLDWDGLRNVRDLGGLPTPLSRTGTTVVGRIARGPRRELMTTAGWSAAGQWGLRSIVDLRAEVESGRREGDPDAHVPGDVSITRAPTEDWDDPQFREVCLPVLDSPEYWQHNVRILPDLVRATLEAIAASTPGVLVHCSAGRDRTGMVAALLLANAGVAPADILADYGDSVRAMATGVEHGGPTADPQALFSPAQVEQWLGEVGVHVVEFAQRADAHMAELHLDPEVKQRLRAFLTE
ncbi:tyrosine-protein phosphatase [Demequina globuliformis]|uniref:tyrosine-protein phosphatase n=1 Tax=Demequina globuliformis TaxID=676202 RepID=UPI00078529AA|nr:tyrosine-protein phosphatase [Demequina globuliformis]